MGSEMCIRDRSVSDVASALNARWLAGAGDRGSFDRVMIGTVSSDAASPYFGNRERTCIVTRYDKTDVQLAALQTDIECLVMTGGGEPSPYLLDHARRRREGDRVVLGRRHVLADGQRAGRGRRRGAVGVGAEVRSL